MSDSVIVREVSPNYKDMISKRIVIRVAWKDIKTTKFRVWLGIKIMKIVDFISPCNVVIEKLPK